MLSKISPNDLAAQVAQDVYEQALEISRALGAHLAEPKSPKIAKDVRTVVKYAQGALASTPTPEIVEAINSVLRTLSITCYQPATPVARALFDRKAGEPQTLIELVLVAARARLDIELGLDVPIRWLAALGGVSVKTARNHASAGQLTTQTKHHGQVSSAKQAGRWLAQRGVDVSVGARQARAA